MPGTPASEVRTFDFMSQHLQLPRQSGNPCNHFLSIWDDHKTIFDHPWAIRALKSYAALVFIQRKIKIWLLRKRVFSLHTVVPAGSVVLRNILSFLSPISVYPHPTLLVIEKQGLLHAICQVRVLPCGPHGKRTPIHRYHLLHTYMINNSFTLAYNNIISNLAAVPRPTPDFQRFQGFAR